MALLQQLFTKATLKMTRYQPDAVLAAAENAFAEARDDEGLDLLSKNPDALKLKDPNSGQGLFERLFRQGSAAAKKIAQAYPDVLESKDASGATLLMRLAAEDKRPLFLQLVGLGADLHARDSDSNTLMHYAALSYGVDVMLEAAKLGCGKNGINNYGQTPLMFFSRGDKKPGALSVYLSSGFRLDATDNQGLNPTMHAIQNLRLDLAIDFMNEGGEVDFNQSEILTAARALVHKTTVGGGPFMAALAKRHGIQTADETAEKEAVKARDAAAAAKAAADVAASLRNGGSRKPTVKTVKFKTPRGGALTP